MIRINLAKRKQVAYAGASAKGTNAGPSAFSQLGSSLNQSFFPLLLKMGLPILLCVGAYFGYDYYVTKLMNDMQAEVQLLEREKNKIETELGRIKGFESVKADLERNEKVLHNKIDIIQKLVTNRDFAFRSLIGLSQSLPRDVWLSELTETDSGFVIKGNATDVGLVSDLMTKLGQTIYFKDVNLKSTSNDPSGNNAIFELSARRE